MKRLIISVLPNGSIAKVEIPYMLFGVIKLKKVRYVRTIEEEHILVRNIEMATYYRTLDEAYAAAFLASI